MGPVMFSEMIGLIGTMGLILLGEMNRMWYAIPLIASISLVYGATRHELMMPILEHAGRFAIWILTFLTILFIVLTIVSYWL